MRKITAILLVLLLISSLVACDRGDDPIASQGGENDLGGNEDKPAKEWPIDKYKWTGSGKIVDVTDNSAAGKTNFQAYIKTATLDEFTAYIASLKSAGFAFTRTANCEEEPAEGYDENDYRYLWQGANSEGWKVSVTLNKSEQDGLTDSFDIYKYYLEIAIRSE